MKEINTEHFVEYYQKIQSMSLDEKIQVLNLPLEDENSFLFVCIVSQDLNLYHKNENGVTSALSQIRSRDSRIDEILSRQVSTTTNIPKKDRSGFSSILKKIGVVFLKILQYILLILGLLVLSNPQSLFKSLAPIQTQLQFFCFNITTSLILSFFAVKIIENFEPRGNAVVNTHEWVEIRSGRKHSSATEKDIYEHQHGIGSWKKKIIEGRKTLCFLFFWVSTFGGTIFDFLFGRRSTFFGSDVTLTLTIISIFLASLTYIMLIILFNPTAYEDHNYSISFNPGSIKIEGYIVFWGFVILLLGVFLIVGSTWIYFARPVFELEGKNFGKTIFVFSTLAAALTPIILLIFTGIDKKSER